MDHQSFRFYIPGIVFLIPIYFVICFITVKYLTNADIRVFVLVGGITVFPALALPLGWWIYNAYRVWWLKFTQGGYENKEFVRLIRKDMKSFYSPANNAIIIDFTHIKGIESWIKMNIDLFGKVFYPFTTHNKYKRLIRTQDIKPKFTEPLSDYVLFNDNSYDYARSISSVRYGLESSVFAIFLGGIYAIGLYCIWLYRLNIFTNVVIYAFWSFLLLFLTITLFITLIIRWKYADKEYDARLILTTLMSIKSNYISVNELTINIPPVLIEKINHLNLFEKSYAAFDLDNTLLIDDIGDAVFAELIRRKLVQNFSWDDYTEMIKKNRAAAYKKVIEVMDGIEIEELTKVTLDLVNSCDKTIEINGVGIPIPRANSTMQSLISFLRTKGIDILVITASNQISAEIICWKYFGIPSEKVFGVKINTDKKGKIKYNNQEIPFAKGKVNILENNYDKRPLITAGDGFWDKYLLDYTANDGIRLWLGTNIEQYQQLKSEYYSDLDFIHIPRQ
jgi:phosphoserine phosphatase